MKAETLLCALWGNLNVKFEIWSYWYPTLHGISTAIYANEGSVGYNPKEAYRRVTVFHSKTPVCSMMNGFARQGWSNETVEESATPYSRLDLLR